VGRSTPSQNCCWGSYGGENYELVVVVVMVGFYVNCFDSKAYWPGKHMGSRAKL
jgi:hypothetical protein